MSLLSLMSLNVFKMHYLELIKFSSSDIWKFLSFWKLAPCPFPLPILKYISRSASFDVIDWPSSQKKHKKWQQNNPFVNNLSSLKTKAKKKIRK